MRLGRHQISPGLLAVAATPPLFCIGVFLLVAWRLPEWSAANAAILSPVAILVSALTAIIAGLVSTTFSAETQLNNAKVKAAYDAVFKKQWDSDYIKARELYIAVIKKPEIIEQYVDPLEGAYAEIVDKSNAIRNIVNDYELMAIAIKANVLDEDFIKTWSRSAVLKDYERSKPFIDAVRTRMDNRTLYIEFERLAKRWGG